MNTDFTLSTDHAIIFDMDGTLWNALDSYARIWNVCMREFAISGQIEAADLLRYMGFSPTIIP